MNIIEAISEASNEIIQLTSSYIGRIYINGKVTYQKPVDVRVSQLRIPLRLTDVQFIYDKTDTITNVHKTDAVLNTYFPIGSTFSLTDGANLQLDSYGSIKTYNEQVYVDMYCTLQNEGVCLVENVESIQIKDKIKDELNIMIESNEIIKNLLPQYSNNWIRYNDEDLDAIKKFDATKVLHLIDKLEYDEKYYYMNDINSALSQSYTTLPTSVINKIKNISDISITERIQAGFSGVHSYYNPRYVFEWLIYVFENRLINDETLYDEFYLVNKIGEKCNIKITKTNSNYVFLFETPSECNYNYELTTNNVISVGSFIEYNIESISLSKILKDSPYTETIYENIPIQINYLKCVTEIISIISASNYNGITLSEYYSNIDTYINAINVIEEPQAPIDDDEEVEEPQAPIDDDEEGGTE